MTVLLKLIKHIQCQLPLPAGNGYVITGATDGTTAWVANTGGGGGSNYWSLVGSKIYYNSGNVGLGDDDPAAKLHVRGNTVVSGNLGINTISPTAQLHIDYSNEAHDGKKALHISSGTTTAFVVSGGSAQVGIGTGNPRTGALLDVSGNAIFGTEAGRAGSGYDHIYIGDTTKSIAGYGNRLDFYVTSNPRAHIDSSTFYSATSGGPSLDLTPGPGGTANYGFVGDTDTGMTRSAANTLHLLTAGVSGMTMDSSQRVGIGTTSPGALLDIHQNADDSALEIAGYDDKSGVTAKMHVASNGMAQFVGSSHTQVKATTDSVYISANEHLYLDNGTRDTYSTIFRDGTGEYARFKNARLGIGSTNPGYPLHVVQNSGDTYGMYLFNNSSRGIYFGDTSNNGTGYGKIGGVGGSLFLGATQIYTSFIGTADTDVTLGQANRRWGYFYSRYGQIGYSNGQAESVAAGGYVLGVSGNSDRHPFMVKAFEKTTPNFIVASGGNVGIGTKEPRGYFEIRSSADDDPTFRLTNSRAGASGSLVLQHRGSSIKIKAENDQPMGFVMGSTEVMTINSDDTVGIGTVGPNAKLDVRGTTLFGGNSITSGTSTIRAETHTPVEVRGESGYGANIKYVRNNGSYGFFAGMLDNASRFDIAANGGASEIIASFTTDKRLGVNQDGPNQTLDVKGNTVFGESASSTHTISGSMNFVDRGTSSAGANYLWASGTNLMWGAEQIYVNEPGTSEITGGGAANYISYFTSANNITGTTDFARGSSGGIGIGDHNINTRQGEGLTISGTKIQDAGIDASNTTVTSLSVPLLGSGAYFLASIGNMGESAGANRGAGFEPAYLTVGPTQGVSPSGNFMAGGRAVSLVLAGTSGYNGESNPWGYGNFGSLLFHGTSGWTGGARRWLVSNAWANGGAGNMGLGFASAANSAAIDPTISGSTPSVVMSCDTNYGTTDGTGGLLVGNTTHIAGGRLTVKESGGPSNTTPQMTLAYDGSNYATFRTDSSGILSISGATTVTVPPFQVLPGGGVHIDRYTRLMRNTSTNGLYVTDSSGNPVKVATASGTNGGFTPNNYIAGSNGIKSTIYRDNSRMRYDSPDAHHFVGDVLVSGNVGINTAFRRYLEPFVIRTGGS